MSLFDDDAVDPVEKQVDDILISEKQKLLNEMLVKLTMMNERIDSFQTECITPVAKEVKGFVYKKVELQEEFNKALETLRGEEDKKKLELYRLNDELAKMKAELRAFNSEHSKLLLELQAEMLIEETSKRVMTIIADSVFDGKFLDFQLPDVLNMCAAFLDDKRGILNANDMGLGKTFETIALLHILNVLFPQKYGHKPTILWLTKKSLIEQTIQEIHKWNPEQVVIPVVGTWPKQQRDITVGIAIQSNAILITNYEVMNSTEKLKDIDWDIIVIDEVGKLKGGAQSNQTKVWLHAKELTQKCKFMVFLSGTPIQNKPSDMWAYLHLFDPQKFPTLSRFENEYTYGYGEYDEDGNPLVGQINFENLITIMKDQTIRHSKQEVLKDLPDKTREFRTVDMEPEQRELYEELRRNMFLYLDDQKDAFVATDCILAYYTRLRQIAVLPSSIKMMSGKNEEGRVLNCDKSGNISEAMDIIAEVLATGEPAVVFGNFNPPLHETAKRVNEMNGGSNYRARVIDGAAVQQNKVGQYVSEFNEGTTHVLCINMQAGGEGLNLQAASHAIFLEEWWNPARNWQAEDRLHRIGQKSAVTIHILRAMDSIQDGLVAAKIEGKEAMIGDIMESKQLRKGSEWKKFLEDMV